ncbi:OapC/ArvC family zinc-ribbon domain-containing protein [Halosimplex pelagicum]|uniref:Origin-associated protein OapC n=1 Tax=Halosimplex pelagicum TaxID=869886 RepID=A0A7D5P4R6_9EURY|nr:Zn-ribbon containing protein [Halosimplex pelagicum]QLH80803.1 hypothetical protein HZS54_03740 [Halosimplex pelagicum]
MPHQCTSCDRTFADGSKEMLSGCPECGGTKFQFRPDGFDGSESGSGPADGGAGDSGTDDGGAVDAPAESPPEPTDRPGDSVSRTVGNAAATVRDLVGGSAGSDATEARPPAESGGAGASPDATTVGASAATEDSDSPASTGEAFDDDIIVAESEPGTEDTAQADARSQLVDPDEMPDSTGFDPAGSDDGADGAEGTEPSDDETATVTDEAATATDDAVESAAGDADPDAEESDGRTVAEEPDAERADRPDLAELREELNDQFESIRVVEPGQYELNLMELYDREEYIIALQEDGRYSIQVPETWRQADA